MVHREMAMVHCECKSLYCVCYRNAVGFLERRVASAASHPAWSAAETSRPKVLAFLRLWGMLSGLTEAVVRLAIGPWSMPRARSHTPHPTIQHFPLHIPHSTLHISHSTLHISHFTFHTSHFFQTKDFAAEKFFSNFAHCILPSGEPTKPADRAACIYIK